MNHCKFLNLIFLNKCQGRYIFCIRIILAVHICSKMVNVSIDKTLILGFEIACAAWIHMKKMLTLVWRFFFSQSRLQKETIRVKVTLPAWHQLKHPECFLNNITIIIFVSPCTNFHSHNFIQLATSFLNGLIYTDSFCFVLYLFWYSYMFFYPIYFLHLTHIGFYHFCKYLFGHLQSLPSLQNFITDCPTSTTYLTAIPNHQIYLFASFSTPTQTVRCGGRGFYFLGFWSLIQSCYV